MLFKEGKGDSKEGEERGEEEEGGSRHFTFLLGLPAKLVYFKFLLARETSSEKRYGTLISSE